MGKRWIETAVIGACLALAAQVQAQWPGYGECAPSASGGGGGADYMPGPMRPPLAPPGPGNDLSLPADTPNAFDPDCRSRPDYCCNGMWFDVGALGWALRNPHFTNPLLTSGGTGIPGAAGTSILIDENSLNYHYFVGAQAEAGFWLNSARTFAFEADGFLIGKGGASLSYGPAANLFVPTQSAGGTEVANALNAVDPAEVQAASRLWGADGNLMCIGCCCGCDFAFLIGGAYRDLTESVDLNLPIAAGIGPDHFRTRNQLSGGDIGLRLGGCGCSGLFFGVQALIAVGNNHETAVIAGDTAAAGGGITPGGFFATAANSGRFTQNEFSYVPQADLKIGYQLNRYAMVYAGYTFLYWRSVIRPGELIPSIPGNPVVLDQVNFWAQGINLGFEMRY